MRIIATLRVARVQLLHRARQAVNTMFAGGPSCRRAAMVIRSEYKQAADSFGDEMARLTPIADGLEIEDVRRYTSNETERRKAIDDKAKSNLMAITLSITVLLGGLNTIGRSEPGSSTAGPWGALSLLLLVLGVAYLMFGGLKAIDALRITETYIPSPVDESGASESTRKAQLLWCLEQNQRISIMRTNSVSVSHQSMVNGIMCLAVLVVVTAVRVFISSRAS